MATQFQHRLVGTIILVALGVIFLPDLLDGKQPDMPEEVVSIPLRPELEPAQAVVAKPAAASADTWTLEEVKEAPPEPPVAVEPPPRVVQVTPPDPAPEPVRAAPAPKPVIEKAPAPVKPAPAPAGGDFIVQLGAFRNADNVNALVRKLKAAGYRVQTAPAVPRQGELNRVWVGPDAKARLEQQLPALERLTGLKGRVMAK